MRQHVWVEDSVAGVGVDIEDLGGRGGGSHSPFGLLIRQGESSISPTEGVRDTEGEEDGRRSGITIKILCRPLPYFNLI